jgi:hypothetical protein
MQQAGPIILVTIISGSQGVGARRETVQPYGHSVRDITHGKRGRLYSLPASARSLVAPLLMEESHAVTVRQTARAITTVSTADRQRPPPDRCLPDVPLRCRSLGVRTSDRLPCDARPVTLWSGRSCHVFCPTRRCGLAHLGRTPFRRKRGEDPAEHRIGLAAFTLALLG